MSECKFDLRAKILLSFLLTWAVVAAAHVFYYSGVERGKLNAEGELFAWREGSIPAIRGRILDSKGVALAWTELYNDLVLDALPRRESRRSALRQALEGLPFQTNPLPKDSFAKDFILKSSMSPEELQACSVLLKDFPELRLSPVFKRRSIDYPEVKRLLGATKQGHDAGEIDGLNGEEGRLDAKLSGRPGSFKVMLDRNGRWIDGTLKMLSQPEHGSDVRLTLSLDEIRSGATDGRL